MSNAKHTLGPWKFERQEIYAQHAKMTGKQLEDHEGYFRENDGSWVIADADGNGIITIRFQGNAKRGQAWNAPDPEGQANAAFIVTACNCHDDLVEALTKLTSETEAVCTGEFGQDWADHFTPLWNLVNVARAALDKAKKGA